MLLSGAGPGFRDQGTSENQTGINCKMKNGYWVYIGAYRVTFRDVSHHLVP